MNVDQPQPPPKKLAKDESAAPLLLHVARLQLQSCLLLLLTELGMQQLADSWNCSSSVKSTVVCCNPQYGGRPSAAGFLRFSK